MNLALLCSCINMGRRELRIFSSLAGRLRHQYCSSRCEHGRALGAINQVEFLLRMVFYSVHGTAAILYGIVPCIELQCSSMNRNERGMASWCRVARRV